MSTSGSAEEVTLSSVHLDAVRGIAALIVVLGHTRDLYFSSVAAKDANAAAGTQTAAGAVAPHWTGISIGNEAVMVFFVLSGFLVGGTVLRSAKRGMWSWKTYLAKRLTRLWVVLIPALLFGVLLDCAGMHRFPQLSSIYAGPAGQTTVTHGLAATIQGKVVLGNLFFLQTIEVPTLGTNVPLWSLANEFWYYIAFPLLVLALAKNSPRWMRLAYLGLALLIAVAVGKEIALLFPIWALGALLSTLPLRLPQRVATPLAWVFAVLFAISLVAVRQSSLAKRPAEWVIALLFACLMYLLLHQTRKAKAGIYRSVSGFFSRISYTLYLVHVPMTVFLCAWVNRPWHHWAKTPHNVAIVLALSGAVITYAFLFYLAFEANTDRIKLFLLHRRVAEVPIPAA